MTGDPAGVQKVLATAAIAKQKKLNVVVGLQRHYQNSYRELFKRKDLILFTESAALKDFLLSQDFSHTNLLLMSSGNYDNLDLEPLKAKFQTHEA